MLRAATFARRLLAVALVAGSLACEDEFSPTAVEVEVTEPEPLLESDQVFGTNAVFSDRAHALPPDAFELMSTPQELEEGLVRVRPTQGTLPDVIRDDFVVFTGLDGQTALRRVLEASTAGGEMTLETAPAYWHEILRGGTYRISMPFDGTQGATFRAPGPGAVPVRVAAENLDLPALEKVFDDTDVCEWIHDLLNRFGSQQREVCGKPVSIEVGSQVTVGIEGTLDSLRILDGRVRVSGQTDLELTVESGGLSGGRRPVFSPCNRANYRGCLSTPTGAALIDFIRRYAPQIPSGSLTPVRVCVPGTPIRVRSGYWATRFRYVPPTYEMCRVTDIGELPTITLPSITAVANEIRPRIQGHMTVRVIGDGAFTLKVAVPSMAASASYQVTNDLKAKVSIGLFVTLKASILNGGGTVRFTFDDTGRVTQTWTDTQGWDGDFGIIEKENHAELLDLTNPDSVVIRVGVPLEVNAEVCLALYGCLDKLNEEDEFTSDGSLGDRLFGELNVGAKAGASVSLFEDIVWTREQVHPTDPDVDNWHIDVTAGYDLTLKAGVTIPLTGWIAPSVPRGFDKTWECCRVSISDYYGQGRLQVTTATTGVDLDPDGYTVLVERVDTLPAVLDPGTTRIGTWRPRVFDETIGLDGTVTFGYPSFLPCIAVYSDAYLIGNPVWGLSLAAARSAGLNIPTFGATSPCRWLIAQYKVTLSGVAPNCTVVDGAVRDDVWLQQSRFNPRRTNVKELHFDVTCSPAVPEGSLEVTLPPGHRKGEAPPYLLLNGATAGVFETSDVLLLTGLAPGSYALEVQGVASNCVAPAMNATVSAGQTTPAALQVICALPSIAPGTVTYSATTTGSPADPNGFGLIRDGEPAANVPSSGEGAVFSVPASTPTVFQVTDVAGNCQPQSLNPRVVTLDAAQSPEKIDFPVVCYAERPDTVVGTLDASGWPASTVTIRATDGRTLVVNGPNTGELARLTGTSVRVWGQSSATGINVNGYDLRSLLGNDRWLGIVLTRPSGTWLFGEEAIRLVNPPAGLVAAGGNLVWIMGREVSGGVQPTLYGVIRGGS